ncbi:MAG: twin-arginine translocase TatA/TatE family subunit [Sulfuricurvum sp.]
MGIGSQELIVILIIVVLLFGAKKIPELAKGLGKGIKSFKEEMNTAEAAASEVKEEAKKVEGEVAKATEEPKTTSQA